MSTELELINAAVIELNTVYGPPPILSTEKREAFDLVLKGLVECHNPRDFMSKQFVWWMAVASWEIYRYGRHKVLGVERHHRQHLEFVAKRAKTALEGKESRAAKNNDPELSAEVNRLFDLLDTIESTVTDTDALRQPVTCRTTAYAWRTPPSVCPDIICGRDRLPQFLHSHGPDSGCDAECTRLRRMSKNGFAVGARFVALAAT
jgi:hypothetical protein